MKLLFMFRFMLKEPPYTVLTSNIGKPDISSTSKIVPVSPSLTLNSCPPDPCISSATPVTPIAAPIVRVFPSNVRFDCATALLVEEPVAASSLKFAGLAIVVNPGP